MLFAHDYCFAFTTCVTGRCYTSRRARAAYCAPPSLRGKKLCSVQKNRARDGMAYSDQHEVWQHVGVCLSYGAFPSPTLSLTDCFDSMKGQTAAYRRHLCLPKTAAGAVACYGERLLGLDLFDSPTTLRAIWPWLLEAYCLDAIRAGKQANPTPPEVANTTLKRLPSLAKPRVPALGLGSELEIANGDLVGAALLYEGRDCHLSAFTVSAN